jgi:hypothetical protein
MDQPFNISDHGYGINHCHQTDSAEITHESNTAFIIFVEESFKEVFGNRLLNEPLTLKHSRNDPLYELMFCCGSSSYNAIGLSKGIAKHLIQEMQGNG